MENTIKTNEEIIHNKKIKKALLIKRIVSLVPIFGLVVLATMFFIIAGVKNANIVMNLEVIIKKALIVGFLATGATFIFAIGSFDLSLGANLIVSAALGALVYVTSGSLIAMLLTSIVVSMVISVFNSKLATFFKLPVFVMTIAMMSLLSALGSLIISNVNPLGIDTKLSRPSCPDAQVFSVISNIWFQFIVLVIFVVVCSFVFNYLKLGRKQKFMGGNPICAELTGINKQKLIFVSFALAGLGVGLAAFFSIIQNVKITTTTASGVGMNMLIAIVFGGMAISGGPGSKSTAAFIGGFSMAFMDQFMTLLNLQNGDAVTQMVKGALFLIVVGLLALTNRKGLLKR